jgi:hypothetical protein
MDLEALWVYAIIFGIITIPPLVCSCGAAILRGPQEPVPQATSESSVPILDQEDTETGHQEV